MPLEQTILCLHSVSVSFFNEIWGFRGKSIFSGECRINIECSTRRKYFLLSFGWFLSFSSPLNLLCVHEECSGFIQWMSPEACQGEEFHSQIQELKLYPDHFYTYFWMPLNKFFKLLNLLKKNTRVTKQNTNWWKCITAEEHLAVFLRYVANLFQTIVHIWMKYKGTRFHTGWPQKDLNLSTLSGCTTSKSEFCMESYQRRKQMWQFSFYFFSFLSHQQKQSFS